MCERSELSFSPKVTPRLCLCSLLRNEDLFAEEPSTPQPQYGDGNGMIPPWMSLGGMVPPWATWMATASQNAAGFQSGE